MSSRISKLRKIPGSKKRELGGITGITILYSKFSQPFMISNSTVAIIRTVSRLLLRELRYYIMC